MPNKWEDYGWGQYADGFPKWLCLLQRGKSASSSVFLGWCLIQALEEMAAKNGGMVTCPRTGATCTFSSLRKVFISWDDYLDKHALSYRVIYVLLRFLATMRLPTVLRMKWRNRKNPLFSPENCQKFSLYVSCRVLSSHTWWWTILCVPDTFFVACKGGYNFQGSRARNVATWRSCDHDMRHARSSLSGTNTQIVRQRCPTIQGYSGCSAQLSEPDHVLEDKIMAPLATIRSRRRRSVKHTPHIVRNVPYTMTWKDLSDWQKSNEYIISGYRR